MKRKISYAALMVTFILSLPLQVSALTRDVARDEGHLFTYSIEPAWKSGPITKDDFRLYFSLFNDDESAVELKKIIVTYPKNLKIKKRPHDGQPLTRPRGENVSYSSNRFVIKYDDRLRGYEKGSIASRSVYSHFLTEGDSSVDAPLKFSIHWSSTNSDKLHKFTLKKPLKIGDSRKNSEKKETKNDTSTSDTTASQTVDDKSVDDATKNRKKMRKWYSQLLEGMSDTEGRQVYNSLGEGNRTTEQIEILKSLIKEKFKFAEKKNKNGGNQDN